LSSQDEEARKLFAENKLKAIDKINRLLMSIKPEEKERVFASAGKRSFTLSEMRKEIEEETRYGKQLTQILSRPRVRLPEKEEKR
jgi:hypothetical protein